MAAGISQLEPATQVFDADTGALKRTLPCEWACGAALDRNGDLVARDEQIPDVDKAVKELCSQ